MKDVQSENMKGRVATESEAQSLDTKIKTILQNKIKNNFKNMDTLTSIDQSSTIPITSSTTSSLNMEGFSVNMQTEMDDRMKSTKTKWEEAFKDIAEFKVKDLQKPSGWKVLFETLFYIYPKVTGLIVDDFVDGVPAHTQGNIAVKEFLEKREQDKVTIKHTAHEFGYLLLAMYFSHMLYARIYGTGHEILPIENYLKTGYQKLDKVTDILFCLIYTPCYIFKFLAFDGFKSLISLMGLDSYPSLKFIFIFILCYHFAYFNLDKFIKMFLDVFEYKADPTIYLFILAGYIFFMVSNSDSWFTMFSPTAFFLASIILLIISLILAPFSQLLFSVYSVYGLAGSPFDWYKIIISLFTKTQENVLDETQLQLGQSTMSNTNSILGGFDFISYKYAIQFLFFFLMLLFFLFKTIQSAIELKVTYIRTAVSSINAYITATMLIIYIAKVLSNRPNPKQEFVIGKKNQTTSMDPDVVVEPPKPSIHENVQKELDTFSLKSPMIYNDMVQSQEEIQKQSNMLNLLQDYLAKMKINQPSINASDEENNIMSLIGQINENIKTLNDITQKFETMNLANKT